MKHTIELNGKRYNALTGEPLEKQHHRPAKESTSVTVGTAKHRGHVGATLHGTKHAIHPSHQHKGKKSLTLMRRGLKKPVIHNPARQHRQSGHSIVTIAQIHNDTVRLARISRIPKSNLITRFGH